MPLPRELQEDSEVRFETRFMFLILLALVSVLAGIFISEPIIFVSVPIIALIGFTVLQLKRPDLSKVEVTRTLERVQINEGETSRVRLTVKNSGTTDIDFLQISDQLSPELCGSNTRSSFSLSLRAGKTRNLLYEVSGTYFGEYTMGPVLLVAEDSAGLMESRARRNLTSTIAVFPGTAGKLSEFTIGPRSTRPRPGEILARRIGAGMDYFATRQLLPGESTKRVNWRASARMADEDKLLSNEFTSEQVAEVLIVLDGRGDIGDPKDRTSSITSYSVKATMSIAERLLRDKNRVGLLAIGEISERIAPSYGRRQFDSIAVTLTKFNPGRVPLGVSADYTVRYYFPRVSQIVLISPLMDYDNREMALDLVRSSGTFDLMVVSPNPLDFPLGENQKLKLEKSREGRLGLKIAELERKATIRQLEAARAVVLDWHVREPLEQIVATQKKGVSKRIAQLSRR